ncbi:MAG: hypothetical protein M0P16_00470 [Syntrophales bacterium]|jgi:hypothetical protein|nr:hypothetical protein [Syntrophales bacterium]MCK9390259.1 hypothetical protein [Syntrophales bacterium]
MAKCRFLYDNLITAESMISVSSLKLGVVTTALKEGTGAAVITPSGDFTGAVDLECVVEIDALGTGEIGSSTFKVSYDGGATWAATGIATDDDDISLSYGFKVKWAGGTGADFVVGDKWYFKGINLYNPGKMLDFDRDSRYRSDDSDAENTITIHSTVASQVKAVVIGDHNLTSTATITLQADAAATFDSGVGGAPELSESVTWAAGKILHYLTTAYTKAYTRLKIQDTDNADDYIEIGELFLGSYMELSKNFREGFGEEPGFLMDANATSYGVDRERFYSESKALTYEFERMPSADLTLKRAFVTALGSRATGVFKRFWFNADSATPADVILAKLISWPHTHNTISYYDMPLQLTEVLKSI